jgi:hypothetical protein
VRSSIDMASSEDVRLRVTFVEEGISAVAELDWQNAGATCSGIVGVLPITGEAFHGIYSGSEVACLIPSVVQLPRENATSRVLPGDIAYYRVRGGTLHGFPHDIAEICWFYDRDATPSMPDGPVSVNVFGRFDEGWEEFGSMCRAMRTMGARRVRFEIA